VMLCSTEHLACAFTVYVPGSDQVCDAQAEEDQLE